MPSFEEIVETEQYPVMFSLNVLGKGRGVKKNVIESIFVVSVAMNRNYALHNLSRKII